MLTDLLKNSKLYEDFVRDKRNDKLAQAYILFSADKESRQIMADMIARLIECDSGGCEICKTCKMITERCHPDVKWYNLDGKMLVENADNLIEDTYKKGWQSDIRLYFIDNAEKLSTAVQNKLLKIYEEPPEGVIIFLLASSDAGILQTISSRAKKVYLSPFSNKQIYDVLLEEGTPRTIAETATVFSDGRFDRAHSYAESDDYIEIYNHAFDIIIGCKKSSDVANYLNDIAFSKEKIKATLEIMGIIFRDVLETVSNGKGTKKTVNRDYDIEQIAKGYTAGGVALSIMAINKAESRLQSNVSPMTVAEKLLFEILEAKYKCQ